MVAESIIWWIRRDLRLQDNPALLACVSSGVAVIPVFIHDTDSHDWQLGGASKVWLAKSLSALRQALQVFGSQLIIRVGNPAEVLTQLSREVHATHIHANARYEPWAMREEQSCSKELQNSGMTLTVHSGSYLLYEPISIRSGKGTPYQVFTPFYKKCIMEWCDFEPLPAPKHLQLPETWPATDNIDELGLQPEFPWHQGILKSWQFGEQGAERVLQSYIQHGLFNYGANRDFPAILGTSRLSPYLHFGEITPRVILQHLSDSKIKKAEPFIRELLWREFAYHILFHFPHTTLEPLKENFKRFQWHHNEAFLKRWQSGQTGYPIIDAGMRQLWETGWMHNRVRMIVASFLVKDLLISWQYGAAWFWDTLVDADLANNSLNWQWVAGCGADAQPFFRIFNPVTQSQKFDPDGVYIRQWIPELSTLPNKYIHAPWTAPPSVLSQCQVQLGKTYPQPIIDHEQARSQALIAYKQMKLI